jgi:sulfate transport system permease protein
MSAAPALSNVVVPARLRTSESRLVKNVLIGLALLFLIVFLVLPLAAVFTEALAKGWHIYLAEVRQPETLFAARLTLMVVAISVPLNLLFGLAASWAITKFDFPGKNLLITLIDLPLAVSPVVAGLVYVLVFGRNGWLGPWLAAHDLHVIYSVPGIVLATVFVTFPFLARELIPFMQSQGREEEEAAAVLGANGWHVFFKVTLPNIKWSLLYGVILASSRAAGEFGAVSVVSGHIQGQTTTLPLQVEILYNEYNFVGAFAAASLLSLLAVVTLVARKAMESKMWDRTERLPQTGRTQERP